MRERERERERANYTVKRAIKWQRKSVKKEREK